MPPGLSLTSASAQLWDEQNRAIISATGTDVSLLWLANKERLGLVLNLYLIGLCMGRCQMNSNKFVQAMEVLTFL